MNLLNPNLMKISYLYSLKESLTQVLGFTPSPYSDTELINIIDVFTDINVALLPINPEDESISLLWQYIYSRYGDMGIFTSDKATLTNDENKNLFEKFLYKLINKIAFTQDRYSTLIKLYTQNKNDLLKQISTTSTRVSRFNDTPQDEGVFSSDEHTTNLTEDNTTASTDKDSLIIRLAEIQNNFENLYKNWLEEFTVLFIEELNYED